MCLEALTTVWKDNHCLLQQTTNAILLVELSFAPQHTRECDEPQCICLFSSPLAHCRGFI
ncbi:hypothetical protein DPMN_178518 [Dreissena polymorpha]|uniref:Uncharacterized protein n=1 Tax=Dreissena polymorpha TaxID=45954 RepID=A0A9D4IJY4_DREPO|nr:hypothetical protein DPMN_178518 [Dreissena polymorpha]